MKTWSRSFGTSEWAEGLPSNRMIALNTDAQEGSGCLDDVKLDQQQGCNLLGHGVPYLNPKNTKLIEKEIKPEAVGSH